MERVRHSKAVRSKTNRIMMDVLVGAVMFEWDRIVSSLNIIRTGIEEKKMRYRTFLCTA